MHGLPPVTLAQDRSERRPAWDTGDDLYHGQQVTTDEKHGISRSGKDLRSSQGDIGGNFFSQSRRAFCPGGMKEAHFDYSGVSGDNWWRYVYDGPILAVTPTDDKFPSYSASNLAAKGTTAVSRVKPTNNVADLGVAVGEIFKEGLPHLMGSVFWKDKTSLAKQAGDEYLNYEFGWVPLVSDIRGASYAVTNAHKELSLYERNSGKVVRRRYEFPIEKTEAVELLSGDGVWFSPNFENGITRDSTQPVPRIQKTTKFYRRTWFSGAFTYHLPVGYRSRDWLTRVSAQAGPLLGLELTPNVLWNLAPWSWAIDWFSNVGDVVTNLSDWATDGLVMRYGYIMEHTRHEVTYTMIDPTRFPPYGKHHASPLTFLVETKRREKATPFGFGATWNTFTPRQLAIAAALGITRVF